MPARPGTPGGYATAVVFSNLTGRADEVPTLQGEVTFSRPQVVATAIQDVHSFVPEVQLNARSGAFTLTAIIPQDHSWLDASVIIGASCSMKFSNGRTYSLQGVTIVTDPVQAQLVAGTTNELSFVFASSSET